VATRVGAVPDLVSHGQHGVLVEPGDIAGLAAGLSLLLADAALAQRLGAAGRERVEAAYTWSAQADKTHEVLRRVIAGAAAAE
jgi:glycosyltransferase involved in cell wall biosynthesis